MSVTRNTDFHSQFGVSLADFDEGRDVTLHQDFSEFGVCLADFDDDPTVLPSDFSQFGGTLAELGRKATTISSQA